jgi:hypothetical protein
VLRAFEELKSSNDSMWQQENAQKFAAIFGATPVDVERKWLRASPHRIESPVTWL